ncbi:UNVERIFIED_CONTAM: hypothetical protein Sangu_1633800 [Sesamum angustifolium]|uniref:Myb/SANT-like domain-containing protein n=1 Tax=Sesamum angustifolium TaxID=2727405 RepID=A0AAW2MJ52_9LAMI
MSGQNPSSNHCSRTYWTPTMERYFVDLMLEHIHRGNRIGHTFNKQAWTDMLAVFNAKFGSQYDKDVLKGRYTNLWKLFNDVKNLLGQKGFSWDETQQMVVADDYVWEAYIKIHPETRPYRTKSVLNFDDLCLIYGYTVADGRYSRSSHDVDVEDENPGAHLGERNSNLASSSSSRTDWTPDMDQYFIELMLKQQERGNKLDSTFTKQAWTEMLALFNANFSSEYNKRVLRHRYKKLWKYYSDLMTLVKQKGFVWDEKQEMVVAHNDVWDAYIKAHPHARSYRAKVFPGYNSLALIFGEMTSKESQIDCHQDKDIKSEAVVAKAGILLMSQRVGFSWEPSGSSRLASDNYTGEKLSIQIWEVLKNRYKHFRKQYNDVMILLQHKGFSWDESREMVTAEDHVWDAYIKAHPDARSYRVKTVPCYHKLCVIYGQDKFDASYSRLVGVLDPAVGTFCMKIGNGKREESHAGADPITDWSRPMEQYFVDLMLEQVHHGYKIDNEFGEQAWAHMTLSFKEKFGSQYEQHILENRYLSLMKQYIEISNLLNQEGFLWDEASHKIVGDNDTWELYAKNNFFCRSIQRQYLKDKVIGHYSELCTIFGPNELVDVKASSEMVMELDLHPIDMKIDKYSGDLPVTFLETEIYDQARKRTASTSLESCNKAQKTGITSMVTELVNKEAGNKYFAIESAIDALQSLPDIDDELLLDGCDLLEDERKAKTFLALDATIRKKWLLRKLGRS